MSAFAELQERARVAAAQAVKDRASPRFQRVMGKMLAAGLIVSNLPIPHFRGKIRVKDYLWAAGVEPRMLEMLPALVLKCPGYFTDLAECPADLRAVVRAIKNGRATAPYRGIASESYLQWVPQVGRRNKEPTALKSFRFTQQDLKVLRALQDLGYSEIGAIRQGLLLALAQAD